ncbi:Sjogren's syndrome/scleroderma autoantigen 1 family protein [Archaeoglobus sp.]
MSDKKISEKDISSAAELLYKGAKMLAYHCPDCKIPLFEKDGKIFCPSCGREAVIEGQQEEKMVDERLPEPRQPSTSQDATEIADLSKKIELAMSKVCDMIMQSRSVEEVKELSESLEKLADVMKKLK